jgi:regulator of sigma E protease
MGMQFSPEAQKIGFQNGDIPLLADGKQLNNPATARLEMLQAKEVKVLRNGTDTVSIAIPKDFIFTIDEESKNGESPVNFMSYRIPVHVTQVAAGQGAAKADMKENDYIIALDTVPTPDLFTFFSTLANYSDTTIPVTVARATGERVDTLTLQVPVSSESKLGIGLDLDPSSYFDYEEKHYNIFESIPRGIELGVDKLTSYASSMKLVFTKEGAKNIGGFGAIGSIFPEKWDWLAFWNIAAFLSVALAFMNILPIPALDGGHVLFLLYEVITRRKPSEKFMERAQMIGMGILLLLLLYANGMDIVRLFIK